MPLITIRNFSKSFGARTVVNDLSFEVNAGEVFAFLGANGSGKTTTIRCLLNILPATAGELLIDGKPYDTSMAHSIGYLPEERGLYLDSPVLEVMAYFGQLKGLSPVDARASSLAYLERVGLAEKAKVKVKTLSSGQQQKVQLGITIVNKPSLLILDEPTKGLDPVNRTLLMEMLQDLQRKGSTIVFITHQMEEVEEIANRLVMIKDGKRALYGTVHDVRESFGEKRIRVDFSGTFPSHPELYSARAEHNTASLTMRDHVTADEVFRALAASNLTITKFEVALPSLNEIFVRIQEGKAP